MDEYILSLGLRMLQYEFLGVDFLDTSFGMILAFPSVYILILAVQTWVNFVFDIILHI